MSAASPARNCSATSGRAGCSVTAPPQKPSSSESPNQRLAQVKNETRLVKSLPVRDDTGSVKSSPMKDETDSIKSSPASDVSGDDHDVHPIYGKFVRISDLIPVEDKVNRLELNESHQAASGINLKAISTLSAPVSRSDSNITGLGIGSLREPVGRGAGSPDPAAVVVPAVLGGIVVTVLVIVLALLLLRKRKTGVLFRKKKSKNYEIEMDVISPKTEVETKEAPMYALIDKNKKNKAHKGSPAEQEPLSPLIDSTLRNGSSSLSALRATGSLSALRATGSVSTLRADGSVSTLRVNSRISLPEPPLPLKPDADSNGACASDTENEYEIPGEHQYEYTANGVENVYESTEDDIGENVYEPTEDALVENVYETTDGNEYALYDVTHRNSHIDGIKPEQGRTPNGFIPNDNVEEHVYESTEGEENVYEATDWPKRPPLPPIRPLSLPVMKTPPQIRPGHLLPKSSRPITIGAAPPEFDLSDYQHNPDDYDAYLEPICHDHSWSPYHTYDPVYEKGKTDGNAPRDGSVGHDTRTTTSGHSSDMRNRVLPVRPVSDSDSSVYEYIEGGDNTQSGCKSDQSRTDSLALDIDTSREMESAVNIMECEDCEHEYTPLTEVSSPYSPGFNKSHPQEPQAEDNIYEPYQFHQTT